MSDTLLAILAEGIFGGSILLVIYLVYYEWKTAKIAAEKAEIELGEKENEDAINSLDDTAVLDLINKDIGSNNPSSNTPPKK